MVLFAPLPLLALVFAPAGPPALPSAPAPASLTIVPPMFYSDIVRESELIVIGTVTASTSRWEGTTIRTFVDLDQLHVAKGTLPSGPALGGRAPLTLRFDGGTVGADTIAIADLPRLAKGKRYLLYVSGNGRHVSPIVGFHQGLFEVATVNGREVLLDHRGQELLGIRDDRFVFRATERVVPAGAMPAVVAIDQTVVPARADVRAWPCQHGRSGALHRRSGGARAVRGDARDRCRGQGVAQAGE